METKTTIFSITIILLLSALGAGGYFYDQNLTEIDRLNSQIVLLSDKLSVEQGEKTQLSEELEKEKNKNDEFEDQINEIADTVGILDKLSKTDEELLQKYSKVYFLNEHYVPEFVKGIDDEYVFPVDREIEIHGKVWPYLEDLLDEAKDDGLSLMVTSGYRSFGTQSTLKGGYKVVYGSGANAFSADQGYSEHQLGTTVDFTTPTVGSTFVGFENTPEYEWLLDNADRFGFTLSYPENNAYYQYEPWHWRFVGESLAKRLVRENLHFYDMDQRVIDEYLVEIFD